MGAFEELWEGSDRDSVLCSADSWWVGLEARSLIKRLWQGPPGELPLPANTISVSTPTGKHALAPAFPGTPTSELSGVHSETLPVHAVWQTLSAPRQLCGADKDRWGWDPLGPGCPGADLPLNVSVALSHCLLSLCDLITKVSFRLTQTVCFASNVISNFLRSRASARWNIVTLLFPAT